MGDGTLRLERRWTALAGTSEVCVTRGDASLLTLTSTPASENEITLLIGSPPLP
jgi:hypothetical protein